MVVGVHIREASSAADANAQAKRSAAYIQILKDYPPEGWDRRHLRTVRHNTGGASPARPDSPGAWMVEFEVSRRWEG